MPASPRRTSTAISGRLEESFGWCRSPMVAPGWKGVPGTSSGWLRNPTGSFSDYLIHRIHGRVLQHIKLETEAHAQVATGPDTVVVQSGGLTLRALLWQPVDPPLRPGYRRFRLFDGSAYRAPRELKGHCPGSPGETLRRAGA